MSIKSENGFGSYEEEQRRIAFLLCALKTYLVYEELPQDKTIEIINNISIEIHFTARHFAVNNHSFQQEIETLANQFLNDGTWTSELEKFTDENENDHDEQQNDFWNQMVISKGIH